ncbi:MAG: hypothetical protein M0R50_05890 [Candidatus Cloacimonetes bacterium]|nr:hypothetical protein [Candidatus Cloacimonadota bacterium]
MLEQNKMPSKPITPDGTKSKKTFAGPHGGGTAYNQLAVGNNFAVHDSIPGHTQKKNVEVIKPK